jgi:hypothetical protein
VVAQLALEEPLGVVTMLAFVPRHLMNVFSH